MNKETPKAPHERYHVPNLKRALEVFELLAKNPEGMSLPEIARATAHSKSSIFRIICTLEDCGYVRKNSDERTIRMSRKLAALGYASFGESNIVEKSMDILRMMRDRSAVVELDSKLTSRAVNEGFSGGEKKKNEIFQMAMLDPKLAILDETDSGLDIDALRIVATGVTKLHTSENATVVITHYQRLLDYIVPDYVHVLYQGQIIYSGDKSLALKLEKEGYDWLINQHK
jgi:Fe-S cluster assembly ATPase SufC